VEYRRLSTPDMRVPDFRISGIMHGHVRLLGVRHVPHEKKGGPCAWEFR
jgi:hypothetical protein